MKPIIAVVLLVVLTIGSAFPPTLAADTGPAGMMPQAATALPLWQDAQALVVATKTDVAKAGLLAIQPHVADLERALARVDRIFAIAASGHDTIYVLADGQSEASVELANAPSIPGVAGRKPIAVTNPYPQVSFLLGTYYNEIGRSADALRVLDIGLALPTAVPGATVGLTRPSLISERAVALTVLKRWPDALAAYTAGLQLPGIDDAVRGRMLRGRGFALTELGRLDEAESAYRKSLAVAPNNPVALKELAYLARLRAGASPTRTELLTPGLATPK